MSAETFYRASTSNGPTKHHIVQEGEIKSLCRRIEAQTTVTGDINMRSVVEINDLSSKPSEKWCKTCKKKYGKQVKQ